MQTDAPTASPYEQPPIVPVEMYSVPEVTQQVMDVSRYEPYSIAASIESMFAEAEEGFDETRYWDHVYEEQQYPNDTDAFRMYMKEVYRELKGSDTVQALRMEMKKEQPNVTNEMVGNVFRAFERIVDTAARRLRQELSPDQLRTLKRASRQNLDWSYRGLLAERLTQDDGAPVRYALEDFFLILNPKARKVQYMERREILKSLRYTMSLGTRERLEHDVRLARQFAHDDSIGERISDDDLAPFESTDNELTTTS